MSMNEWRRFWRRVVAFVYLNTPMRTYGELVLRTVTIAERTVAKSAAVSAGHNER